MPQSTDIVLNGAGYMVQPGTYRRAQDGASEGRAGRIAIRDFFGGQRRSIQLERDRFGDSLNVGPALNGQGVTPWAPTTAATLNSAALTTFAGTGRMVPHAIMQDTLYFAMGTKLFKVITASDAYGGIQMVLDAGASTITDVTTFAANKLLIAYGTARDIDVFDVGTNATTVLTAGQKGFYISTYAGYACWTDPSTNRNLRMMTGSGIDVRNFDYEPIGLTTVNGFLVLITKQCLYTFTGRVKFVQAANPAWTKGGTEPATINVNEWSGELSPWFQNGMYAEVDDYRFVIGYGGRVYTWFSGGVMEANGFGNEWQATGLTGARCYGMTVAGGYLIVATETVYGLSEVWAWDGQGWWCILRKPYDGNAWCWPMPLAASAGGRDLLVLQVNTRNAGLVRLQHRHTVSKHAFNTDATFVTPMIDAMERDKNKAWMRIGAVFASPERFGNLASVDSVGTAIDYSIDGGNTWTEAQAKTTTQVLGGTSSNTLPAYNFTLDADLAGATSRFIMLRVRWWSVADWAPILTGVWAEYEVMDSPARRRVWDMTIHARDQEIDRDGVPLARTGRQLIADLWSAWQSATPLTFRDIDYDAAPTQRTVRIVGIRERVQQPADSSHWGESDITLKLLEV